MPLLLLLQTWENSNCLQISSSAWKGREVASVSSLLAENTKSEQICTEQTDKNKCTNWLLSARSWKYGRKYGRKEVQKKGRKGKKSEQKKCLQKRLMPKLISCYTCMRMHYLLSKERDLPSLVTAQSCQLNTRGRRRMWGNIKIPFHSETVGVLLQDGRTPGNKQNTSALLSEPICSILLPLHNNLPFFNWLGSQDKTPHACFWLFFTIRTCMGQLVAFVFLQILMGTESSKLGDFGGLGSFFH